MGSYSVYTFDAKRIVRVRFPTEKNQNQSLTRKELSDSFDIFDCRHDAYASNFLFYLAERRNSSLIVASPAANYGHLSSDPAHFKTRGANLLQVLKEISKSNFNVYPIAIN